MGTEAQNAAGEGGLRITGSWASGMGRSGPAPNCAAPCRADGQHPRHERAGFYPTLSAARHGGERCSTEEEVLGTGSTDFAIN